MKLSDLTGELQPVTRLGPASDPTITHIVADSRAATEGSLFVAVHGEQRDGHDYIDEAVARGARAVVAERPLASARVPVVQVSNTRRALAQLAAAYYARPARQLDVIAVTGTVGKTSTSLILQYILQKSGQSVGVIGSLGIKNGNSVQTSGHTTPDALTLQKALKEMQSHQIQSVIMEVSSHALAQERTFGLGFRHVTMTNLFPLEHLEYHPTFEHYVQTKARVLDQIDENGVVIYNFDDPNLSEIARLFRGRTVSFGLCEGADVQATRYHSDARGSTFDLRLSPHLLRGNLEPQQRISLHVPLLGLNNVTNALAAIATALCQGVDLHQIGIALAELRPFKRRMERFVVDEVTVIDDTTGHPSSFEHLFACVRSLSLPPPKLVVAIRGSRGPDINEANARTVAAWFHKLPMGALYITSADDLVEDKDRVTAEEREAFLHALRTHNIPYVWTPSLQEAIHSVVQTVTPGDFVILAGAQGMDQGARLIRELFSGAQPLHPRQPL